MKIIGLLLVLIIILGIGYWYYSENMNPSQVKFEIKNLVDYLSEKGKMLINGTNVGRNSVELSFSGLTPNETLLKSFEVARDTYAKSKIRNITVMGYLNFTGSLEPFVRVNVINGDFDNAKVEDMRTDRFKIMNNLWLYDFVPDDVSVNGNEADISFEYYGNSSNFKYDLVNAAFNIFEDVPAVDRINFKLIGINKNLSFSLSRSDIVDKALEVVESNGSSVSNEINENNAESSSSGCAPNKDSAYKRFVEAYNDVVQAQHNGTKEQISEAYGKYKVARACYESFLGNNSNSNNDSDGEEY